MATEGKKASHFASDAASEGSTPKTTRTQGAVKPLDVRDPDGKEARRKKRKRSGCMLGIICLCILMAALSIGGFYGYKLYQSALSVRAEAKDVMSQVSVAKDAVKSGDAEALQGVATSVSVAAYNIYDEVNTPLWDFACGVPIVGSDIRSVRTLANVLVDLSDNALTPIAQNSDIMNLKNIFHDGQVDVPALQAASAALEEAAPVIARSAEALEALPEAHIPQISDSLEKVRSALTEADDLLEKALQIVPYLPRMLGADGQARHYLIVAQNNAESRSTGGLPGSWGTLTITDGKFDLGEFTSILHEEGLQVGRQDDESFWGTNFDTDPAQVNFLADFSRVGVLCRDYWVQSQGQPVDGVFALDPVFLQKMLALTGPVTAYDGTTIDGGNAATELLSNVYWRYENDNEAQDAFFAQTAGLAAKSFFANIGDAGMMNLLKTFFQCVEDHRFYAWMADEEEEALMVLFGCDGKVSDDPMMPELGVYINDSTYSKISWYIRLETEVGEPEENADGTKTYPVRIMLTNTLSEEDAWYAPSYVTGHNDAKRSDSDMLNRVFVLGPAGGSISDATVENGNVDQVTMGSVYGVQAFKALIYTYGGETTTFTCRVTVSADATEPLRVRMTPLGREENMVVTYAWDTQSDN